MDKATRAIEERRHIINKIRGNRNKASSRSAIADSYNPQLPPLGISPKPPKINSKLCTTITSQFRIGIEAQLQSIIQSTLTNFRNQKIRKIIFTSPITNRLGKTYYPTSFNSQRRHHSQQPTSPLNLNESLTTSTKKIDQLYMPSVRSQMSAHQQEDEPLRYHSRTLDVNRVGNMRGTRMRESKRQEKKKQKNERFSPWHDQNQGELLI